MELKDYVETHDTLISVLEKEKNAAKLETFKKMLWYNLELMEEVAQGDERITTFQRCVYECMKYQLGDSPPLPLHSIVT